MSKRYVRTQEAAKALGFSASTFERWRQIGSGPPYRKLGNVVVYDLIELVDWFERRSEQGCRK